MKALPKMLVDEKGEYIVKVIYNEDGDPIEFQGLDIANPIMDGIGVKRFEKLRNELTEAAKNIVNPPSGGA